MHAIGLTLHIGGGTLAILSGFAALALRKGSTRHALAGNIFLGAMLMMATMGGVLALGRDDIGTASAALVATYLVATAWMTARNGSGTAGRTEQIAFAAAVACAGMFGTFTLLATTSPSGRFSGYPAAIYVAWAVVFSLAASLDLNFLLRGTLSRVQRLRRHLWRMCTALFIASGSFFLGQQKVMPLWMKGSPWLFVPALAPLVLMIFWLVRVSFRRRRTQFVPTLTAAG